MHAKAFFLFTARCFSHLYIYFSQRVLCSELPKDLFTQWLTDSCLSLFIVPHPDYGEIKTCSLASQKFIMSVTVQEVFGTADVISGSLHLCALNVHTTSLAHAH